MDRRKFLTFLGLTPFVSEFFSIFYKIKPIDLSKLSSDILFGQSNIAGSITLYTGIEGMIEFDWAMQGLHKPHGNYQSWVVHYKKVRKSVINLVKKHGNLKIVFDKKREFYNRISYRVGTEEVMFGSDFTLTNKFLELYGNRV